jgi:lysozyme
MKIYLPHVQNGEARLERAKGIDVSSWNNVTDWQAIKAAGYSFTFIKSTEGNGYADTDTSKWDGAGSVNILRSNYHFLRLTVSGRAQADWFLAHAKKGELPPVIDFEDGENLMLEEYTGRDAFEIARAFLTRVYEVWGQRCIFYTGQWYLYLCFNESPDYDARWLADYPLWIANYIGGAELEPQRPSWWPWTFYQWTSSGAVPGVVGRVDLNVYKGTLDELRTWAGVAVVSPPVIPVSPPVIVPTAADYAELQAYVANWAAKFSK